MAFDRKQRTESPQTEKRERSRRTKNNSTSKKHPIRSIQQTLGNQAVQELIENGEYKPKLKVSHPRDHAEREADRVAAEMTVTSQSTEPISIRGGDISTRSYDLSTAVKRDLYTSSHGRPLPEAVRSVFEPRFGADFGGVRVHTNSQAANLNRKLNAKAFTYGTDIYFGAGQYRPGTASGDNLVAHELTHVIQQTRSHNHSPETIRPTVIQRSTGQEKAEAIPDGEKLSPDDLSNGDTVETTANLRIREGPGLDQAIKETTPVGVTGDVVAGPVFADGYKWWLIEYHAGYRGWSAEPWLKRTTLSDIEVETDDGGSVADESDPGMVEAIPEDSMIGTEGPQPGIEQSNPRELTTQYWPQLHGSEEDFKRFMATTYLRRNFTLLMLQDEMKPIVEEILERILLPQTALSGSVEEGEFVTLHVNRGIHRLLERYYALVEPNLTSGEIEDAKLIARVYLPELESIRTLQPFRGGFRTFRIRAIYGIEGAFHSAAGKALLYEIEERGQGKGPLKETSEGITRESPPSPRKKTIGYIGFGGAIGVRVPVDEAVEMAEELQKETQKITNSSWFSFTTPVHMFLEDFEGAGGVAGASLGVGSLKSLHFDCPDLAGVTVTVEPGFSPGLELGLSADLTGGQWLLDPPFEEIGDFKQEIISFYGHE